MANFVPLKGFLPDLDPTIPGIILECNGFLPSKMGLRSAFSAANYGYDALAAACKGFTVARKTDGTTRVIAGTESKLYEISGTSWVDRTRASGGDYTTSTGKWRFGQFGNITYAVNKLDTPQYSSSGAFADHPEMPKCAIVETANQFVLIGNTNDATYGDQTDRWWCSAIGDPDDFTTSVATQCVTARLTDVPGAITAIRGLDEQVAFFKQRGLYVATYQGPPTVWGFRLVSQDVGTFCQESAVKVGSVIYFMGYEDFYLFDGTVPRPIGDGIREWFFNEQLSRDVADKTWGFFDRYNMIIYWFYASVDGSGTVDKWIAYRPTTGTWGAGTLTVEAAGEFLTASPTYDSFGLGLTYDTLPDVVYDSSYWGTTAPAPAVFTSSHILSTLDGASGTGTLKTGWVGDDQDYSTVRRVIPRWKDEPTSATLVHTYVTSLGGTEASNSSTSMEEGRFDVMQSGRWHQDEVTTVGTCDLGGFAYDTSGSGQE